MRKVFGAAVAAATSVAVLMMGPLDALALENAFGYAYDGSNATYAAIEGAAPAIRDGGFSYMRTGGQRIISGNTYYVEIGWIITAGNSQMTSYWTYRDVNGVVNSGYGNAQYCCDGYNYQVLDVGSGNWNLYFNDLNTPVTTVNTGFDYTDDYFSGGEVSSASNAMGVSGNDNVAYLRGGSWYCACDWQAFITNGEYSVVGVINDTSWQVYGNN
jgi:hypothetical protein